MKHGLSGSMVVIGLLARYPARRGSNGDPVESLRGEWRDRAGPLTTPA